MSHVTVSTMISRDVGLLAWCVENVRKRAGIEHDWIIIGWAPTGQVQDYCAQQGLRLVSFEPQPEEVFPNKTAWFLHNLYHGWNLMYAAAETQWVVRLGSDQYFSHDWLRWLIAPVARWGERAIYHCWTVESPLAKKSRHEVRDFGLTWDTFDVAQFDLYANHLIHRYGDRLALPASQCGLFYLHPTRGMQTRPDGVTWLQTKALWDEFGPMPDGINVEGVTGDVAYHDKLTDAGVPGFLVPPCVSYHLVQGESRNMKRGGTGSGM